MHVPRRINVLIYRSNERNIKTTVFGRIDCKESGNRRFCISIYIKHSLKSYIQDHYECYFIDGTVKTVIEKNVIKSQKVVENTEYDIEGILFDYKQLMMISDRFNASVAYKTLMLHIIGGSQFVSDVFAATHGKKIQRNLQ